MAVSFTYVPPPSFGELRQGEILANVIEYRPIEPVDRRANNTSIEVQPIEHAFVVIISQDCDLLTDFGRRSDGELEHQGILRHVLICDMFQEEEIRGWLPGSDIWRRVRKNQDERFHCLPAAVIANELCEDCGAIPIVRDLPPLYLDFKRVMSLPTADLYRALETGESRRVALLPSAHLHDLVHRLYSFLSRVGLPV